MLLMMEANYFSSQKVSLPEWNSHKIIGMFAGIGFSIKKILLNKNTKLSTIEKKLGMREAHYFSESEMKSTLTHQLKQSHSPTRVN